MANSAVIVVDGEDLFDFLQNRGFRGKVKVRAAFLPTKRGGGGRVSLKKGCSVFSNQPCKVRLTFSSKKSAVMAKLSLGGS